MKVHCPNSSYLPDHNQADNNSFGINVTFKGKIFHTLHAFFFWCSCEKNSPKKKFQDPVKDVEWPENPLSRWH